jgi:hypothetical protein
MAPSTKKYTKDTKNSEDTMMDDDEETVGAETNATKMDFIDTKFHTATASQTTMTINSTFNSSLFSLPLLIRQYSECIVVQ